MRITGTRRRDVHPFGGAPHTSETGHPQKGSKLIEIHKSVSSVCRNAAYLGLLSAIRPASRRRVRIEGSRDLERRTRTNALGRNGAPRAVAETRTVRVTCVDNDRGTRSYLSQLVAYRRGSLMRPSLPSIRLRSVCLFLSLRAVSGSGSVHDLVAGPRSRQRFGILQR